MRIAFYELEAWEREYPAGSALGQAALEFSSEPLPADAASAVVAPFRPAPLAGSGPGGCRATDASP